ncbi:type II toxin-antitoxin system PemK/MazF family toxin [Pseudonocardia pini]|uniref:type II toxin-antitoxin system PemK/MazF family toxin n=1 Tax=Pseudonocardia pini TaxID=2758030 RepID=UPI001C6874EC|nr:type II toxin-antitoxin system PemK/MazF family toxin [Pseudonocardia pini]
MSPPRTRSTEPLPGRRGELWWADLGEPRGSAPAYRRPVVVVSSDRFNRSRLRTVVVAAVTSNQRLAAAPGNVSLSPETTGLDRASVINVSQLLTVDRDLLEQRIGTLHPTATQALNQGLRLSLSL